MAISFTFCFLYIIFYVSVLFLILTFFFVYQIPTILSQVSFTNFWQALSMYSRANFLFKSLVFQLAGFPPMYVFFIKLNYLIVAFYTTTFITAGLIAINFICGMLFYIQLFQTNTYINDKQLLKLMCANMPLRNSATKKKLLKRQFQFLYLCWGFFFFSLGSCVFLTDSIFLISIYLGW